MEGSHLALDVKDLGLHRYDGASDRMGTFCETGKSRNQIMSLVTEPEKKIIKLKSENVSMGKMLCFKVVWGRNWRREYFFETTLEYNGYNIKGYLHMRSKLYV